MTKGSSLKNLPVCQPTNGLYSSDGVHPPKAHGIIQPSEDLYSMECTVRKRPCCISSMLPK